MIRSFFNPEAFPFLSTFIIPLGVMVNYGDLQFAERIMVARRSEMDWTGQPYKNTQNCVKSSKNHPSWPSENPKVWKTSWWELTSPLDLPTMVSVKNVIRDDVWLAKTSNAHKNSAAHIQEKNSWYTAMPTARQKILSTSWNVQFVVFNIGEDVSKLWNLCPIQLFLIEQ